MTSVGSVVFADCCKARRLQLKGEIYLADDLFYFPDLVMECLFIGNSVFFVILRSITFQVFFHNHLPVQVYVERSSGPVNLFEIFNACLVLTDRNKGLISLDWFIFCFALNATLNIADISTWDQRRSGNGVQKHVINVVNGIYILKPEVDFRRNSVVMFGLDKSKLREDHKINIFGTWRLVYQLKRFFESQKSKMRRLK